jgi:RHS repeat-associated protein
LFAAKEKIINSLSGSQIKPFVAGGANLYSMAAEDQHRTVMNSNPNWPCYFKNKQANASVVLRFDDSKRNMEGVNWTLNVTYNVALYGASNTPYIIYNNEVASIEFNKNTTYNDIYLKSYEGAYRAEVTITNVLWTPTVGSPLSILPTKYDNDVFFDVIQETERFYNFQYNGSNCVPVSMPEPIVTTSVTALYLNQTLLASSNNQLPIAWNFIEGAESYDVEWVFIDVPSPALFTIPYNFDFNNATRVNVTQQHYEIPMAFPRGIVVYRVRGVGEYSFTENIEKRVEGAWSATGGPTDNIESNPLSSYLCYYEGLDKDYNWQYSAAFAEDGKRKEVISYFDGSLRNRQTVTVLNSDDNAVIAETKYDYQGRPTVQILPTPIISNGIKYYTNFNAGFSKQQFDIDANYISGLPSPATMPNTSGAGNYYGTNNAATGSDAYVPNAQGYPYSQTRYKTDGTGRVVSQSGVGPTHALGAHDTRYVYGTPGGQQELDRLFGNEAGNISHYKKNIMADANGQLSVTYLDQEGRVIATALAGTAPSNLVGIPKPAPTPMLSDMLTGKNDYLGNNSRVAKTVFVTSGINTVYSFDYILGNDQACYSYVKDPTKPTEICNLCDDCIYNLEIRITNEEGTNLTAALPIQLVTTLPSGSCVYNTSGGGLNSLIKCTDIKSAHYSIDVTFPEIGSYTVEKIISISQAGIDAAATTFTTAVKLPPCGPLTQGQSVKPCNDCEYICNKQYGAYGPTYVTPVSPPNPAVISVDKFGHPVTVGTQAYTDALNEYNMCFYACDNIAVTSLPTECELKAQVLFKDMSPGGQYFDNLRDQIYTCSPSDPCSPENPAYVESTCINDWLDNLVANTPGFWSNFYNYATSTSAPTNCTPVVPTSVTLGTFSNWTWIRANWQSCFGKYLIKFHPEYCNFNFYCGNTTICDLGSTGNVQNTIPVITQVSPGVLSSVQTNVVTMNHVNRYDEIMKFDVLNRFTDPIVYVGANTPALYKSDLKTTPTQIISSSFTAFKDPLFIDSRLKACDLQIYCSSTPSTSDPLIENYMKKNLTEFFNASINSGSSSVPMSIWYVLDDPDGISTHTTPFTISSSSFLPSGTIIDQVTVDFFQSFRNGNLSQPGSTKYDVFKNFYAGKKQFVLYGLYVTNYNCGNSTLNYAWSTPPSVLPVDPNETGFTPCTYNSVTNALPHAQIRFSKNDLFDAMLADCPNFAPDMTAYANTGMANICSSQCIAKAEGWIATIKSEIANCNLGAAASGSLAVLANIKHDLIEICTASCDGTNQQGLDHIPASPVNTNLPAGVLSFNDVLNYYLGVAPYNSCSSLISNISIVNPAPETTGTPYSQAACICDNIKTFALNNSIAWNLTDPNLPNLIATAINDGLSVQNPITSADVCAWMAQCYQGTGSCFSTGTPPLDINVLTVPIGSGVTTHSVPDALMCPITNELPPPDPCDQAQALADVTYGNNLVEQQAVAHLLAIYKANYIAKCLATLDQQEKMTASYSLDEYYYTLYYYDQAGNLIKTVPPEGFRPIYVPTTPTGVFPSPNTNEVASHRVTPTSLATPFVWPSHLLITNYKYNTLNQIREQLTPDGGKTVFFYDAVGRLIVSQNAKQEAFTPDKGYSYTFYDELSRIKEVGEILMPSSSGALTQDIAKNESQLLTYFGSNPKRQITRTYYDAAPENYFPGPIGGYYKIQSNKTRGLYASNFLGSLRNRVSCVTYSETDLINTGANYNINTRYYDNASHYTYDIHGNVRTLYLENTELANFDYDLNRVDYNYDLISGKVNEVHYNSGKPDQFHHQYYYDADNRITSAYSSRNGAIWEKEAKYFYYKHGPLFRSEIGDKQVQATDYAYTIHGWIKGVNSNSLDRNNDIGLDGKVSTTNLNQVFAQDAYGYSLGYYNNDYISKNSASSNFLASNANIQGVLYPSAPSPASHGAQLFNGNIANMVTSANFQNGAGPLAVAPIIKSYRYDQLNRIKNAQSYNNLVGNTWGSSAVTAFTDNYKENFTYDMNGNIKKAIRYNESAVLIDDLDYGYKYDATGADLAYNKLYYVKDDPSLPTTGNDFKNQLDQTFTSGVTDPDLDGGVNYHYDKIGNLIEDKAEQIQTISWTVYGKIKSITRLAGSTKPDLEFVYDASGNRIKKLVKKKNTSGILLPPSDWLTTYYMRDAQGNVMATYENLTVSGTSVLNITEQHVYGSSRLGLVKKEIRVDANTSMLNVANFKTSSTSGWSAVGSVISVDAANRLKVDLPANVLYGGVDYAPSIPVAGKTYEFNFDIDLKSTNGNEVYALVLDNPSSGVYNEVALIKPVHGTNRLKFTARNGQTILKFQTTSINNSAFTFYVDNIAVKEIDKQRSLGDKAYEFSNHLGNVLTVVSDRKVAVETSLGSGVLDYYTSDILSSSDYYSFGSTMPNRNYQPSVNKYRYGFNGKENDLETGNQDFGERIYSPSIGKFLSIDPMADDNPSYSSYSYAICSPISLIDHQGLVADPAAKAKHENGKRIEISTNVVLKHDLSSAMISRIPGNHLGFGFGNGFKFSGNVAFCIWNIMVSSAQDGMNLMFDSKNLSKSSAQSAVNLFINSVCWYYTDKNKAGDVKDVLSNPATYENLTAMVVMSKLFKLSTTPTPGPAKINISLGIGENKEGVKILRQFADKTGSPMHEQWRNLNLYTDEMVANIRANNGSFIDLFKQVASKVVETGGRISFNMEGIDMKRVIRDLLSGGQATGDITTKELITILNDKNLLKATDFYDSKGVLINKEKLIQDILNDVKAAVKKKG